MSARVSPKRIRLVVVAAAIAAGVGKVRRSGAPWAGIPSSPTTALTIRTVPDQAQLVVQIVLTRSSNTVGLRSIRPAPASAQLSVGSARAMR